MKSFIAITETSRKRGKISVRVLQIYSSMLPIVILDFDIAKTSQSRGLRYEIMGVLKKGGYTDNKGYDYLSIIEATKLAYFSEPQSILWP